MVTITATDSSEVSREVTFQLTVQELAPVVGVDAPSVTVVEGTQATNTGTWSHPSALEVLLNASVGIVIKNGDGTWSWTYTPVTALPPLHVVTITATDSSQVSRQVTFELTVQELAPIISVDAPSVTVVERSQAMNSGAWSHPSALEVTLSASVGTVIKNGDGTWNWTYTPRHRSPVLHVVTITSTDSSEISRDVAFELTVQTQTPVLPGDLNGDAIVDGLDASVLYDNWGGPGSGDIDNNGIIDGADLAILFSNWTGDSAVAARIDSIADDLVSSNLTSVRPDGRGIE